VNESLEELAPPASVAGDAGEGRPNTVLFMDQAAAGTIASEREVRVIAADRPVTFGREPTAHLRIGHAPVYDDVVPKLAGRAFAMDGRVVVENLHDTLAFDVRVDGRALLTVPPGHWHAPPERTFDVLVTGTFTYELAVTVNSAGNPTRVVAVGEPDSPEPPTGARPRLTDRQRRILDSYVAPLAAGGHPASHPAGCRVPRHQPVPGAPGVQPHLERAAGGRRADAGLRRPPGPRRGRVGPPPVLNLTPVAAGTP